MKEGRGKGIKERKGGGRLEGGRGRRKGKGSCVLTEVVRSWRICASRKHADENIMGSTREPETTVHSFIHSFIFV